MIKIVVSYAAECNTANTKEDDCDNGKDIIKILISNCLTYSNLQKAPSFSKASSLFTKAFFYARLQ